MEPELVRVEATASRDDHSMPGRVLPLRVLKWLLACILTTWPRYTGLL